MRALRFSSTEVFIMMQSAGTLLDRGRAFRVLAAAALLAASLAVCADITFKSASVKVGAHALRVEIAASDPQRMQGLMYRKKLGRDDGMLFVFDEPAYQSMWMKNTLIPLSVAFIDGEGRILNILDMEPQTLETHTSAGPAVYAIETNKGWFEENRVKPGEKVTGLPKPK
jgi:uncharacterized membrane protein (UPF0127 family)